MPRSATARRLVSVPPEHDEKLPSGCVPVELAQRVEVPQYVLVQAPGDVVRVVADQGSGLCFVCRESGQQGRKVDLPEQFLDASHMSRREGRGVWPEGSNGMRMRIEEGEVDGSVAVESLSESTSMDTVEASELADPFDQERCPVQVEDVRRRWIPEVIPIRRCGG